MGDLLASYFFIVVFGLLLLAANLSGVVMASRTFRDAAMFQTELREERARLRAENEKMSGEISRLKEQVLEIRQQYNTALDQIAELGDQYNAALEKIAELNNRLADSGA